MKERNPSSSGGAGQARRAELGRRAEERVAQELQHRGYTIVARNVRVGRLEIDIIAQSGNTFVVCEVRAVSSGVWLHPAESVNAQKIQRVRRAAVAWLQQSGVRGAAIRFDVAAVIYDTPEGRIDYYENAF